MLTHLSVQNFALIEKATLEFGSGLLIVTGTTGSGKSMLVSAINLLLGGRANSDVIRGDKNEASIQGIFALTARTKERINAQLKELAIPIEDQLIIRRSIRRDKKNRVFINDVPTSVSTLAKITAPLVDLIGQHQHLSLIKPAIHRSLIDRFGELEHGLLLEMQKAFKKWNSLYKELQKLRHAAENRIERIDFLQFQLRELKAARLKEGEFEKLEIDLKRARNSTTLRESSYTAANAIIGGQYSADHKIAEAINALNKVLEADPTLVPWVAQLEELSISLSDVGSDIEQYARNIDNELDQDSLERRHIEIKSLMRRFVVDFEGLFQKQNAISEELLILKNYTSNLAMLEKKVSSAQKDAWKIADQLYAQRKIVAKKLFSAVKEILHSLSMQHVQFDLQQKRRSEKQLRAWGGHDVEILFSANPGEALQQLSKVASGGELSRLLLAFKNVLANVDQIDGYLFDEVDTGVSGVIAIRLGELIAQLAYGRQIICITHLPQIAAYADEHYHVEKFTENERTYSKMSLLSPELQINELAKMLGGNHITETTLAHARELREQKYKLKS